MSSLFTDLEWRDANANVIRGLAHAVRNEHLEMEPNELPSAEDARILFDL